MRIVANENVPGPAIASLRVVGHDVLSLGERVDEGRWSAALL